MIRNINRRELRYIEEIRPWQDYIKEFYVHSPWTREILKAELESKRPF